MDFIKTTTERFQSAGLKITPQRLAVFKLFDGNKTHPTAEDIFSALTRDYPHISFTTVYNILKSMVQLGSLRELTIDRERIHYDPDTSSHHHAMCTSCGKIIDVMFQLPLPKIPKDLFEQFTVDFCHINFYGTCRSCQQKGK
ncbi:MAG: transcriptional repressor [Spirochaetes bacterium]|nr:transcriptional repressor [Spirochaetota bacterium]